MINSDYTNELIRSPTPLILCSIISGVISFTIVISVDYTPIPLAIAVLLVMLTLPTTFGYTNQSFASAIVAGAIPVCLVLWAPYARTQFDISNIWTDISVFIVGFGAVLPFATVSYIAGLSLHDRSALRDRSRDLLIRGSIATLLFMTIIVAYLQGILSAGRVN